MRHNINSTQFSRRVPDVIPRTDEPSVEMDVVSVELDVVLVHKLHRLDATIQIHTVHPDEWDCIRAIELIDDIRNVVWWRASVILSEWNAEDRTCCWYQTLPVLLRESMAQTAFYMRRVPVTCHSSNAHAMTLISTRGTTTCSSSSSRYEDSVSPWNIFVDLWVTKLSTITRTISLQLGSSASTVSGVVGYSRVFEIKHNTATATDAGGFMYEVNY